MDIYHINWWSPDFWTINSIVGINWSTNFFASFTFTFEIMLLSLRFRTALHLVEKTSSSTLHQMKVGKEPWHILHWHSAHLADGASKQNRNIIVLAKLGLIDLIGISLRDLFHKHEHLMLAFRCWVCNSRKRSLFVSIGTDVCVCVCDQKRIISGAAGEQQASCFFV